MKIFELLLEYDVNKIKQLDSALSARERDDSAPEATSAIQLADYLDHQLGVKSGELVFWILHRYLKKTSNNDYGIKRWEDISSRLLPAIEKYTKLKNKNKITGNQRDINQFKSLSQLEDLLDQFPDEELASQREQTNAIEQQFYSSGQAVLVYNDSQIKVVVPKTQEASCYFGINTRWCTAAKKDNKFSYYSNAGPLYIVLIKPENARYQFHFQTNQYMNERDEQINPNQLADKYPVLWKIFTPIAEKNKSVVLNQNPSLEVQLAAVNQDGYAIYYIKDPSPEVQLEAVRQSSYAIQYIKEPSLEVQLAAVRQSSYAIQYIKEPSLEVQLAAVNQDGYAIQYIKEPSLEVQLAAVNQDGYAIYYIKDPSPEVQLAAVRKNGILIRYIKKPSLEVQLEAVQQNPNAIKYIRNPSPEIILAAEKAKKK